jgi:hypothetical protein
VSGGGFRVMGTVQSRLDQISVVSLEAFTSDVTFEVDRYFRNGPATEDDDADAIVAGIIDLGELAAETIAIELDPYPRADGESFGDIEVTEAPKTNVSPFAVLAKKQDK